MSQIVKTICGVCGSEKELTAKGKWVCRTCARRYKETWKQSRRAGTRPGCLQLPDDVLLAASEAVDYCDRRGLDCAYLWRYNGEKDINWLVRPNNQPWEFSQFAILTYRVLRDGTVEAIDG